MKTKSTIVVLAILALAGVFAIRSTREAVQNRAALDALATQSDGLRAATAAVEQRLRTASAALAQLEQKNRQQPGESTAGVGANAATAASGNDSAATPTTPARRTSGPTLQAMLASDQALMAEWTQVGRTYSDIHFGNFKGLGLSAEQAAKLKDIMVLGSKARFDHDAAAERQGLDPNGATYKQQRAELQEIQEAKEAELLGDLTAAYREYNRAWSVRALAKELAGAAVYSGEPVTSAQVARTTQILAANSQRRSQSLYIKPNTVNWDAASVQLQGLLSPSQIVTLGDIIQDSARQAELKTLLERLTAEFKARLPAP